MLDILERCTAMNHLIQYVLDIVCKEDKANHMIDVAPLFKEWHPGNYVKGDLVNFNKEPHRCVQAHDSTSNPTWNPDEAPALWSHYHGTDEEHALPYYPPTGSHDAYMEGEFTLFSDGKIYKCLNNNTVHSPKDFPSGWEVRE